MRWQGMSATAVAVADQCRAGQHPAWGAPLVCLGAAVRGSRAGTGAQRGEQAVDGGGVSGWGMPGLMGSRAVGPAGGAGQRVTLGLAAQVSGLGLGKVIADSRLHGGLLDGAIGGLCPEDAAKAGRHGSGDRAVPGPVSP